MPVRFAFSLRIGDLDRQLIFRVSTYLLVKAILSTQTLASRGVLVHSFLTDLDVKLVDLKVAFHSLNIFLISC